MLDLNRHNIVIEIDRPEVGLRGFIAIHSQILGPAVGGTRMYPYASHHQAREDVLKLSRAMTNKCAIAGVNFGGGKGVIIGDPKKDKSINLLKAYAEEVNKLNGQFFTGEDVGISSDDTFILQKYSKFIIGCPGGAGDPSPFAALSTYVAMKAASKEIFGHETLAGKRVIVKGVGKVGLNLVRMLCSENAHVVISDIDEEAKKHAKALYPSVTVISPSQINTIECEIFSPCAMGDEFREESVSSINAKIICGGANNQLSNERVGKLIFDKGIIYVPDYVANCGGLINVVDELNPSGYNIDRVKNKIYGIAKLVSMILQKSRLQGKPTNKIADSIVNEVLESKKNNEKKSYVFANTIS